jgi:hypothetical protein
MLKPFRLEDYLVDFPDSYYEGPVADAPLVHKVCWVCQYTFEALKSARRSLIADAEIPAIIASLAIVDYLAGFHAGRVTKSDDYKAFLREYFPDAYAPFIDRIYSDLRCGLLHNLVAVNPWQPVAGAHFHLIPEAPDHLATRDGMIAWSSMTFLGHIGEALVRFQHHLIMDTPANAAAIARFHKRFDCLGGAAALMRKRQDHCAA